MSLFCVSCQVARRILYSKRSHIFPSPIQVKASLNIGSPTLSRRNFSVLNSSVAKTHSRVNKRSVYNRTLYNPSSETVKILVQDEAKIPLTLPLLSPFNARGFSTKVKVDGKSTGEQLKEENDQAELEKNLTEEERQILRELEEEERRFRENLSSTNAEEDYSVWDGSFEDGSNKKLQDSVSEGHVHFENRQRIIQDVIEEIWNPLPQIQEEEEEPQYFPRGKTGVFDLPELVDLLREENAHEIVAISLPHEIDYADHMVIVTVGNNKHLLALATFVRKRFKMKDRKRSDILPHIDRSVNHQGWIALDLGNIILHIFLQNTRDYYDLETLWTVGPLFDDLTNAPDPEIVQLLNSIK